MKKNFKDEPYPENMATLVTKCEEIASEIENILAGSSIVLLNELYEVHNNKLYRQHNNFKKCCLSPNYLEESAKELKGLYVFAEKLKNGSFCPCYIGISRSIYLRLKQHGWHSRHDDATLAYLQASTKEKQKYTRKDFPRTLIKKEQELIKNYAVVIIPEKEDFDLHFMEVYLSGRLKTKWNSYKTH